MENNLLLKNRYSRTARIVWGLFIITAAILVLSGAVYLPYLFESQTLRYQFGMSRTLLRIGHVMGTVAGVFIFIQPVLISRIKILDRIFSINRLLRQHRINAAVILFLACSHFLLIFGVLGKEILAVDVRQWPEFTGLILLIMLAGIVFSGFFRGYIGVPFRIWMFFHRVFTPAAILLLCIHVYFVSETFRYGNAKIVLFGFITLCFLFNLFNRLRRLSVFRYACRVDKVYMSGNGIYTLELIPEKKKKVINLPGQFVFLKFRSINISGEEHPFTISSSPTRPPVLQFTIRASGDWTRKVRYITKGDSAFISGPYGIFGHLDMNSTKEMIMIAGGIGITPMLSMLRYLSDVKSGRNITLLWSNRTQNEVVYPDEFKGLEENLPGLSIQYLFTRGGDHSGSKGRLSRDNLEGFTSGCSKDSIILLCGPPGMMHQVKKILISLGFPRNSIIAERFAL